jgi:hypothetical protein
MLCAANKRNERGDFVVEVGVHQPSAAHGNVVQVAHTTGDARSVDSIWQLWLVSYRARELRKRKIA